ncbi:MAG: TonB-dependent receptor [Magnetococcales bacterium]|nr:TonB-dependent receptor [Magnetococcales bacterium]
MSTPPATRIAARLSLLLAMLPLCDSQAEEANPTLPDTLVTASRLGEGISGASTTLITAAEIERSPGQTLPDLLARQPGIQVQNLYGGVNGANSVIDLRGFGAAAVPNTLVLINARRLNDVDLAGIDLGSIPRASIERIEIIRGSSGAVLYGDGAVGGVINIVTKNGFNDPPSYRAEGALGSFRQREGNLAASQTVDATALSLYGNTIDSNGYRANNALRQSNAVGEIRQSIDRGELYLNLSGDTQHLGLPGARQVTLTSNQLASDRTGTASPADYADKQGMNAALGGTRRLGEGMELVLDAGIRHKEQQSAFFSPWGSAFDAYTDTALTTLSLTPRITIDQQWFARPGKLIAGIDLYQSYYGSDKRADQGNPVAHHYDLEQRTLAGYFQETVAVRQGTDLSWGVRLQQDAVTARDHFNASAPNPGSPVQAHPLDHNETPYAAHIGLEQRLSDNSTLFGRLGRSMRLPTVDERVGGTPYGVPITFDLKTQTAQDAEVGWRGRLGKVSLQSSVYFMELKHELHFNPVTFTNINLDPTQRYGVENTATYPLTDTVRLNGGLTYTRAQFTEGAWQGHEVPLVSRWTGSGGLSWDIRDKQLVLDGDARYVGPRRLDNDQANFQPLIPAHTLVDLRLGGEVGTVHWSLAVQNLFDQNYFDYGIASATTYGTYNAYPMPGRTILGRFGVSF